MYLGSTSIVRFSAHSALAASIARKLDHPASCTDFASRVRPKPLTLSASCAMTSCSLTSLWAVLWWKSARCLLTLRCSLATTVRCFARRLLPFFLRASKRWARRSFFCALRKYRGASTNSPSEVIKKWFRPRSIPTSLYVGSKGFVSTSQMTIKRQRDSQKNRCWWCGKKLKGSYHVDHRIPLSRGGSNWPENIVIACPFCNLSKCDKTPLEFAGRLF